MQRNFSSWICGTTILFASCSFADEASDRDFFETKIRPLLVDHCYECHSRDADDVMGGLRVDTRNSLLKGGDTGPALVPGDPKNSLLLTAIRYDDRDLQMPPDNPLPGEVVAHFEKWIRNGGYDPRATDPDDPSSSNTGEFDLEQRRQEHWAWAASDYDGTQATSIDNAIDQFIDEKLRAQDLQPSPLAAPESLFRRLYFDLIGLPPTVRELDRFLVAYEANREQAIRTVVDRLLEDARFGEHWARHWLDVVRYSETKGHVTDQERPFAWKYRDYVIRAFNDDKPYDRFVVEHVAGDLLDEPEAATATGVLFTHEMHFMAVDPVKQRWDEVNAQIDVVSKAFLGLTVECARCHDHKFDAISQADYYALAGFFLSTEQGKKRIGPRSETLSNEAVEAEEAYTQFLASKIKGREKAQSPKAGASYFPISEELGIQSPNDTRKLFDLMQQLESADASWSAWVRSAKEARGQDAPLLVRGNSSQPKDLVPRRFLTALGGNNYQGTRAESGRLWLAQQLVADDNPLIARVWVNRIWHHLFARGIVSTPNNFGVLGGRPSHPRLLDYLADQLKQHDWSTKAIVRAIVLSETYQREAKSNSESDPSNQWLAHQNVRRLTAEQIRDALLTVSEELNATMFGPSVDCFVPPYATANKPSNVPTSGPLDGNRRRSIYIKVRRNFFDPFLLKFDFPNPSRSIGRRDVTNVPSQSLAMMNSPLVHELAEAWGQRLASGSENTNERIRNTWRAALTRFPSDSEVAALEQLVTSLNSTDPESSNTVDSSIWKDVAHVILNHPDFIWLR